MLVRYRFWRRCLAWCCCCFVWMLCGCETSDTGEPSVEPDGLLSDPMIDSNSNWLTTCLDDESCGENSFCLCGVCSVQCGPDATCGEFRRGSSCAERGRGPVESLCDVPEAPTGPQVDGLCLPPCNTSSDCIESQFCIDGLCVPRPPQRPLPPGACRSPDNCRQGETCMMGRCVSGTCPDGPGLYCGSSLGLQPEGLYRCEGTDMEMMPPEMMPPEMMPPEMMPPEMMPPEMMPPEMMEPEETCPGPCEQRMGEDDVCAPTCPEGDGLYCGEAVGRSEGALFLCSGDIFAQVLMCQSGCEMRPGDDECRRRP